MLEQQLIDTWKIHCRINHFLLAAIPDEALTDSMTAKGRDVFTLFAHIHNVRLMWLQASAPALLSGITKLDAKLSHDRQLLGTELEKSNMAVEQLITESIANGGKVKGFKPHVMAFTAYMISHESHHRGQIEWALKAGGHPLDDKTSYGLWEWGVR